MAATVFTGADLAQLAELGIAPAEAARQMALFRDPPPAIRLDRPCTPGDGVQQLDDAGAAAAEAACAEAVAAGRILKFTPASGAASRMFQSLLAARGDGPCTRAALQARAEAGEAAAADALQFADALPRFAFAEALAARLAAGGATLEARRAAGDVGALIAALLDADGLDYAALPKGLLLFHRYAEGARTPFEEHLVEAAALAGGDGVARLHLTVSPEHERGFAALLERVRAAYERRYAVRYAVGFSTQKRNTDTLAADGDGAPFRDGAGRLVLRPGGHGALIENLDDLDADLVFIKNIDNVQPDHLRAAPLRWMRLLLGHCAALQGQRDAHLAALAGGGAPALAAAGAWAVRAFGCADLPTDAAAMRRLLDRPLRVCGVVRNTGEPGGGPFWVRGGDGACTPQIVESAQVDQADAGQRAAFAAATHFNPVFLACAVRDGGGQRYDLGRFVDPAAVFISRKSKDGRALQALERPGLWNGAMAHWLTVFVEVPDAAFTPVKTVNDLLRPAHQPAA